MITLAIELGRDTAAKLDKRAREHGRTLVDECNFILSAGDITHSHLFPGKSAATAGGVLISSRGDITQSEATA